MRKLFYLDRDILVLTVRGWMLISAAFWFFMDMLKTLVFYVCDHSIVVQHLMHWLWS